MGVEKVSRVARGAHCWLSCLAGKTLDVAGFTVALAPVDVGGGGQVVSIETYQAGTGVVLGTALASRVTHSNDASTIVVNDGEPIFVLERVTEVL